MDKNKVLEILKNRKEKSNKDLKDIFEILDNEFNETKNVIIKLVHHLESVEKGKEDIRKELLNRGVKLWN